MDKTSSFFNLKGALAQQGCCVCRLKARTAQRFLDGLLWEQVNDPDTRQEIRQSGGFCPAHTRQLAEQKASLGVAILTRDVLHSLLEALEGARLEAPRRLSRRRAHEWLDRDRPAQASAALAARLDPRSGCLVCRQADAMEATTVDTLLDGLSDSGSLLGAFEASDGLCLPHLRLGLERVRARAAFEALLGAQAGIWGRLEADLGEFIRKSDYRFRDEAWGPERDAWRRATAALGGVGPVAGE